MASDTRNEDTTPRRSMHYRDQYAERLRRVEVRLHDVELMVLVLGIVLVLCIISFGASRCAP